MTFPHICLWGDSGPSLDEAKFRSNKKKQNVRSVFLHQLSKVIDRRFFRWKNEP
ncbi:hypothetical protein LEP1GSC019_2132 [Leptospira interrogans serovar Pyrogenes str. 2006006960]|nr:hypothetical protein LEP1GSC019_2132 [Leptospira interrogans serovar Pyrogenes str. 2006006960]